MNKNATISFYRDGEPVVQYWERTQLTLLKAVMRQAMVDAYCKHGVDPQETGAIAEQLFICGEARDMFEDITGLEVVLND